MKILNTIKITFSLLCLSTGILKAAPIENTIFKPNIHSVKLFPSTNEIGMPIIMLNGTETLKFQFDDLNTEGANYQYSIIQCDYQWEPTIQGNYMYMDGFSQVNITDFAYSTNTRHKYTNYRLELPNNDVSFKQSGNYILNIFENNPDEPVITWRFMIVEPLVEVNAFVTIPRSSNDPNRYQEVVFKVNHSGFTISNPYMEIKASVLQNQRWDNAKIGIVPKFIRNNELNFDTNGQLKFESGREFRRFDIRSLRFIADGVRAYDISGNENHAYLLFDQFRSGQKYFIENDINGQFYYDVIEYRNRRTDADYMLVHFNIPMKFPLSNGDIYVGGQWNEFKASPENRLSFNESTGMYEGEALLKQGFYNYNYYFMEKGSKEKDVSLTEGNHFDAENDYTILLYYRPFGSNYDRLIGISKINSMLNRF